MISLVRIRWPIGETLRHLPAPSSPRAVLTTPSIPSSRACSSADRHTSAVEAFLAEVFKRLADGDAIPGTAKLS
jgi:hypothetical protein